MSHQFCIVRPERVDTIDLVQQSSPALSTIELNQSLFNCLRLLETEVLQAFDWDKPLNALLEHMLGFTSRNLLRNPNINHFRLFADQHVSLVHRRTAGREQPCLVGNSEEAAKSL